MNNKQDNAEEMRDNDDRPLASAGNGNGGYGQSAPAPLYGGQPHYSIPYYGATHGDGGVLGALDVFRLFRVARKKWKTILIVFLFFCCAAVFYLFTTDRIYRASILIELCVRRPRIVAQQGAVLDDPTAGSQSEEVFNTRLEKMKGRSMINAAVAKLAETSAGKVKVDDSFRKLLEKQIKLTMLRRTRLLKVEFEHKDPVFAADVCNAFAETAEASALDENRVSSDSAVSWLQQQAVTKRLEMEKADEKLLKFREDNKIDVLESQRKSVDEAMLIFNKSITEAKAELESLLARFTDKHPQVQSEQKTIASLLVEINKQTIVASDLELKITDGRMKLAALQRERDANETSYRGILNRIEEARLAADEHTATAKIVERATVPESPVKPRVLVVLFMGALLGLSAGLGLALVVDTLEDHVTGPQDVEMGIGLKVLTTVPKIKGKARANIAKLSLDDKFSQFSEAFAGLRTMLDSPQYKDHSKVVLVSSSVPGEGKTITTCNLAITCAKSGQSVLLIDFDMRRPRLMGIFPFTAENRGLLSYLVTEPGGREFEKLVSQTVCPNLSIIGSRPVKDVNPAELIGGKQVEALLQWARQRYDRVILDAPPLGLVSDATVLAGQADCVLVMSRPNVSRKRAVSYTVQRFKDMGVPLIAGVVNDVDFEAASYHSPYYYYNNDKPYGVDQEQGQG